MCSAPDGLGSLFFKLERALGFFEFSINLPETHDALQQEREFFSLMNFYVVLKRYNRARHQLYEDANE
jgi:hypothetical protein